MKHFLKVQFSPVSYSKIRKSFYYVTNKFLRVPQALLHLWHEFQITSTLLEDHYLKTHCLSTKIYLCHTEGLSRLILIAMHLLHLLCFVTCCFILHTACCATRFKTILSRFYTLILTTNRSISRFRLLGPGGCYWSIGILTPPRHLLQPPVFWGNRVCNALIL